MSHGTGVLDRGHPPHERLAQHVEQRMVGARDDG